MSAEAGRASRMCDLPSTDAERSQVPCNLVDVCQRRCTSSNTTQGAQIGAFVDGWHRKEQTKGRDHITSPFHVAPPALLLLEMESLFHGPCRQADNISAANPPFTKMRPNDSRLSNLVQVPSKLRGQVSGRTPCLLSCTNLRFVPTLQIQRQHCSPHCLQTAPSTQRRHCSFFHCGAHLSHRSMHGRSSFFHLAQPVGTLRGRWP